MNLIPKEIEVMMMTMKTEIEIAEKYLKVKKELLKMSIQRNQDVTYIYDRANEYHSYKLRCFHFYDNVGTFLTQVENSVLGHCYMKMNYEEYTDDETYEYEQAEHMIIDI